LDFLAREPTAYAVGQSLPRLQRWFGARSFEIEAATVVAEFERGHLKVAATKYDERPASEGGNYKSKRNQEHSQE
jgi:hypothetical protein